MEPDGESSYTLQEKDTYSQINEYMKDKYRVNVQASYIAQAKRRGGLDMSENNKFKKENSEVKQCPQEKVEYIKDALRHFKVI